MIPLLLPLLGLGALADVSVPPPDKQRFLTHQLRIEGLDAHPDVVVVAHDRTETLSAHRAFSAGDAEQILGIGGNRYGGSLSAPALFLMARADYDAWSEAVRVEVAKQEEACADRGEGCVHASRFVPSYAPPAGTVDCKQDIGLRLTGPQDGPVAVTDVLRLVEASATSCRLEVVEQAAAPASPEPAPDTPAAPAAPSEAGTAGAERGCTHVGSVGPVLLGLGLLLGLGRRERQA